MDKEKFRLELSKTAALALRYASDFYNIKGKKDFNKLYSLNAKDFQNKCYEGFKLAQDKIVSSLLLIEDEIRVKKDLLNKTKKGKHKKDIYKDIEYRRLLTEINKLEGQRLSFQNIAGVIVWTIFLQEKTNIKSFIRTDGGHGYLIDRDIKSIIKVAEKLNRNPNTFTIINDITSCLHIGDLLTVGNGSFTVTEVKQNTDINNLISEIIHKGFEGREVDRGLMAELHEKSPKYGFKQLKRSMDQVTGFFHTKKYIETEEGYDVNFKKEKKAITLWTKDVTFSEIVDLGIKNYLI